MPSHERKELIRQRKNEGKKEIGRHRGRQLIAV